MDAMVTGSLLGLGFVVCLAALWVAGVIFTAVASTLDVAFAPSRERKHQKAMAEVPEMPPGG